jgi:penicillin-binding protein 1A
MREIHQGLPYRDFARPSTGIIEVTVCAKSGLLKTGACNEGEVTLTFLQGTQPIQACTTHGNTGSKETILPNFERDTLFIDLLSGLSPMPTLSSDILNPVRTSGSSSSTVPQANRPIISEPSVGSNSDNTQNIPGSNEATEVPPSYGLEIPSYNFLLD